MHQTEGRIDEAEKYFQLALDVGRTAKDQTAIAMALDGLGSIYREKEKVSMNEDSYADSRDLHTRMGHQWASVGLNRLLGSVGPARGLDTAPSRTLPPPSTFPTRARNFPSLASTPTASRDISRVAGGSGQAGNPFAVALPPSAIQAAYTDTTMALGDHYFMSKQYDQAEHLYCAARGIYDQVNDRPGLANVTKRLGDVYRIQRQYSKAETSYMDSRDLYAEIGDKGGLAGSIKELGDIYRMTEQYFKAEDSYIEARDVFADIGDQLGAASATMGLGHNFLKQNDYAKAEQLYMDAQATYTQVGDRSSLADNLWAIGGMRRRQARYAEAKEIVIEALIIYQELGMENNIAECNAFLEEVVGMMDGE